MIKGFYKTALVFLTLIIIIFVSGCSSSAVKEQEKEDDLIEALSLEVESGNMGKALKIYEEKKGNDRLLYSILLINNGRIDEAEKILIDIIAENESDVTALFYLSLVYNLKGNKELERKTLERITAIDPDNSDANTSLGRIAASEKKYRDAEDYFRKALKNNYHEEAALGYAMVLLEQKKNDEALKQYNVIIEKNPGIMMAYIDRAYIKSLKEDYRGAEKDLDQAVNLDPDYIWNYLDRGRMRLYTGKYEKAAEDFTKVLEFDKTVFTAYVKRAEAYEESGKNELALEDYKKALEIRSDYKKGYVPIALQFFRKGEWNNAASYFLKAYSIEKTPEYMLLGAASYLNSGDKNKASKLVTESMPAIPRDNLLYHISRLYIDPYYEKIVLQKLNEEKKSFEKMKGMFYLAVYYDIFGKNSLSENYYTEIINSGFPETMEYRLSSWKVSPR